MHIALTAGPWVAETSQDFSLSNDTDSAFCYAVRVFAPHDNDAIPIAGFTDLTGARPIEECQRNAAVAAALPELHALMLAVLSRSNQVVELAKAAADKIESQMPVGLPGSEECEEAIG